MTRTAEALRAAEETTTSKAEAAPPPTDYTVWLAVVDGCNPEMIRLEFRSKWLTRRQHFQAHAMTADELLTAEETVTSVTEAAAATAMTAGELRVADETTTSDAETMPPQPMTPLSGSRSWTVSKL